MEYRSDEIKVGVFVVVAFLILVAFIVAISGIDFGKSQKRYIAEFSYSGGISPGAQVRLGGHLVGEVLETKLPTVDRPKIEVVVGVEEDAPIRTDSEAYITSIGLMGDYYVEITTGSPSAPLLPDGGHLVSKDIPPWTQLGEPMLEVSENLTELLRRLNDILREDNRERITSMLTSMDTILKRNEAQIDGMMSNMNRLTEHIASVGEQADSLVAQNSVLMHSTLEQLELSLKEARGLMHSFESTTANVDGMFQNQRENLSQILANLEQASRNFEDFTRGIKERPWNLVRKSAPKERQLP